MSQPDSELDRPQGILVSRPRTSIFTVLLIIACVALAISCLIMILEWSQYGFQHRPPTRFGTLSTGDSAGRIAAAAPARTGDILSIVMNYDGTS